MQIEKKKILEICILFTSKFLHLNTSEMFILILNFIMCIYIISIQNIHELKI